MLVGRSTNGLPLPLLLLLLPCRCGAAVRRRRARRYSAGDTLDFSGFALCFDQSSTRCWQAWQKHELTTNKRSCGGVAAGNLWKIPPILSLESNQLVTQSQNLLKMNAVALFCLNSAVWPWQGLRRPATFWRVCARVTPKELAVEGWGTCSSSFKYRDDTRSSNHDTNRCRCKDSQPKRGLCALCAKLGLQLARQRKPIGDCAGLTRSACDFPPGASTDTRSHLPAQDLQHGN